MEGGAATEKGKQGWIAYLGTLVKVWCCVVGKPGAGAALRGTRGGGVASRGECRGMEVEVVLGSQRAPSPALYVWYSVQLLV